ncbi:MAG: hypothetical protein GY841_16700, partial [FCB group bacterium]|nr:hypothetical protein [FCB group bacterium]
MYDANGFDVQTDERDVRYVYDHLGEMENLDADPASGTYNGWILREKSIYDTNGVDLLEEYIYRANTLLETKEVAVENDPDGDGTPDEVGEDTDSEFYGDHVKYYYRDEDAGLGFGRVWRIDNITEGWYYEIGYVNPGNPADDAIASKVKKDIITDLPIEWTERYATAANLLKRVVESNGDVSEYDDDDTFGNGDYGRTTLLYDASASEYTTWSWGGAQVTVSEYSGAYEIAMYDANGFDVQTDERDVRYVYDHLGEMENLD